MAGNEYKYFHEASHALALSLGEYQAGVQVSECRWTDFNLAEEPVGIIMVVPRVIGRTSSIFWSLEIPILVVCIKGYIFEVSLYTG